MFTLINQDPPPDRVRSITFVPFLADGRCVLIQDHGHGPALPAGDVRPGEDYLLDTVLRVPMETAGFRYQRVWPFGLDGRSQGEREFYAGNLRTLERAYLRGSTAQQGSGFGGDARAWRQAREHITQAITADGTFLDVGCANGLLMESVADWCAAAGLAIEPYGIDLGPGLVELARRRLPHWAGRIWAGNAIDWMPPEGLRFDYVHVLLDCVPASRRGDLIRHHLAHTVRPAGGRLLVSQYAADPAAGNPGAAEILSSLGFSCAGQTSGGDRPGRPPSPTAWLTSGRGEAEG